MHLLHTLGQALHLHHLSHGHMNPIMYPTFREVSNVPIVNLAAWPCQGLYCCPSKERNRGRGKGTPFLRSPHLKSPLLTVLADPSRHFCVNTIVCMSTIAFKKRQTQAPIGQTRLLLGFLRLTLMTWRPQCPRLYNGDNYLFPRVLTGQSKYYCTYTMLAAAAGHTARVKLMPIDKQATNSLSIPFLKGPPLSSPCRRAHLSS